MPRFLILAAMLAATAFIAIACGGSDSDNGGDNNGAGIVASPGNSELVVGPNRFAFGLADENNEPIQGTDGVSVSLRFFFEDELKSEQEAGFIWAIPDVTGFFVANVDFDQPGAWRAEAAVVRDGSEALVEFPFLVVERGATPIIGDRAPATGNLTLSQEPNILRISTDQEPDLSYYELTIAEALDNDRPLVVVFATPAFCATRFCGPVVDNVKEISPAYAGRVDFIHIEPFELDEEGLLVTVEGPSGAMDRVPVQAILAWNLQTEPWIFIVDGSGIIANRFEGSASPEELRDALDAVLS
ncbi:MAG: hypothetical protein IIB87_00515 [Chloroflexi bacterium]|nr:hypothetical protein [Chloroflexota bacterium]